MNIKTQMKREFEQKIRVVSAPVQAPVVAPRQAGAPTQPAVAPPAPQREQSWGATSLALHLPEVTADLRRSARVAASLNVIDYAVGRCDERGGKRRGPDPSFKLTGNHQWSGAAHAHNSSGGSAPPRGAYEDVTVVVRGKQHHMKISTSTHTTGASNKPHDKFKNKRSGTVAKRKTKERTAARSAKHFD